MAAVPPQRADDAGLPARGETRHELHVTPRDARPGDESVTLIVKRRPRPGRERDLERWIEGVIHEAERFEGYLGTNVIQPFAGNPAYVVIVRFDNYANMDHFYTSDVRATWLVRVKDLTVGEADIQRVEGMQYWFNLQELADVQAPPRWKMALIILGVLYPLSTIVGLALSPVIGGWSINLQRFVAQTIVVALLTWIVVPFVTRVLHDWLVRR
jgi:uncharacterized protein